MLVAWVVIGWMASYPLHCSAKNKSGQNKKFPGAAESGGDLPEDEKKFANKVVLPFYFMGIWGKKHQQVVLTSNF